MADRPNILLLLSDQHNPHIAGFAGNALAHTQNLDRLADRGVRFDAAYCQSPLCVPSRISMLTGKYVHQVYAWTNGSVLYPDQLTFAEHLTNHGYTTALVGKMHLRGPKWMGGFQHRPYGDMVIGRFCFHQPDPVQTWDGRWCDHEIGRFSWAGESEIPESLLGDGVVTRESLAFLLEHVDKNPGTPWFLCAGYGWPHFPFTSPGRYFRRAMVDAPPLPPRPPGYPDSLHPHDRFLVEDFHLRRFSDDIQRRTVAAYYACVDYLDDCIGELLDGLEGAGLLENTYVIYTSDHGEMAGEHGLWSKRSYYDASVRVPFLVAGPGITGGRAIRAPVELLDLFPTFCELAGVPIPDGLEGEGLISILHGERSARGKRFARADLLPGLEPVVFRMAADERWKYVEFPGDPPILFDLAKDPGETTNLLASGQDAPEAPIDELRRAATAGLSWEEIARMRAEETERRPASPEFDARGPVQYQLRDGRIVDADIFLYPGID